MSNAYLFNQCVIDPSKFPLRDFYIIILFILLNDIMNIMTLGT
jgi:hypothetical protein